MGLPVHALALTGIIAAAMAAFQGETVSYMGTTFHTLDSERPVPERLLVSAGRIVDFGAHRFRTVDLGGGHAFPGFADAHGHLVALGRKLRTLDLAGCRSYDELLDRVRARLPRVRPGEWLIGRGWNQELWPDEAFPSHPRLSEITPDNPVWLFRVDGHAGLANRRALDAAGVTRETPNPPGGEVLRDAATGEPTGVLVDEAMDLVTRRLPPTLPGELRERLLAAQRACFSAGLTMVHDAGLDPPALDAIEALIQEGRWKLRVYGMMSGDADFLIDYVRRNPPRIDDRLTVRCVKLFLDGALGSRGAWLLAPYADRPADDSGEPYCGLSVTAPETVRAVVREAVEHGYQAAIHAIGDRANREALDIFAGVPADRRMRIEHAQVVALDDLPRFARQGVIASVQPTHATSDMNMAEERVGPERIRGAYAWQTLLRSSAVLAAGSDFPVEDHKPAWGIYAAVTRTDHEGRPVGGWCAGEKMTRAQALAAFTQGAAYAAFLEDRLGKLAPGMWADFVVWDRDLETCNPRELLEARVKRVVIGGEVVFDEEEP